MYKLIQYNEQRERIHEDLSNNLLAIFSRKANPLILPNRILNNLITHNQGFFKGTIFLEDHDEFYKHAEVLTANKLN